MSLTLAIRNVPSLENGVPTEFVLHRRGATIGRAATCDWSLPDPHRYISSRHCEIVFRDESYWLTDTSTNGTFVNGSPDRPQGELRVAQGDVILIGHYEVVASLSGTAAAMLQEEAAAAAAASRSDDFQGWEKWDTNPKPAAAPAAPSSGWDSPSAAPGGGWETPSAPAAAPQSSGSSGWGPASGASPSTDDSRFKWGATSAPETPAAPSSGWAPTHNADMPQAAGNSVWQAPEAAPDPASAWSSAAPDRPAAPSTDDVWGRIAEGNVVDWARGGFGAPAATPAATDPLGLDKQQSAAAAFGAAPVPAPTARTPNAPPAPRARTTPPAAPQVAPRAPPSTSGDTAQLLAEFLTAAGVDPATIKGSPAEVVQRGGGIIRRLVAGLVVLVEARARAKSQMGAESTRLEFDGNNPIKFARSPEQALSQLLNPKETGFMDSERAVEDAFFDLQSHQMATLKAMQGALRATLDRFAPDSIRKRAEGKGVLAKVLPAARDAALWKNYEREFSGVAQGSDEAFMDVFAKEFRKAYEEASRKRP